MLVLQPGWCLYHRDISVSAEWLTTCYYYRRKQTWFLNTETVSTSLFILNTCAVYCKHGSWFCGQFMECAILYKQANLRPKRPFVCLRGSYGPTFTTVMSFNWLEGVKCVKNTKTFFVVGGWLTLVMSRGSRCSSPPLRVNPHGAPPDRLTSTSFQASSSLHLGSRLPEFGTTRQ